MAKNRLQQALRSELTNDAGLGDYACIFGPEQFARDIHAAQNILEIGCGRQALFASGLLERLPNSGHWVVNLSPHLAYKNELEMDVQNGVSGLAQELPFADESFDLIVSSMAVPKFCHEDDVTVVVTEVNRVLRDGGTAYLWPATMNGGRDMIEKVRLPSISIERLDEEYVEHLAHAQNANRLVIRK